jgi:uncharacterized protein (UPF0218 family)
MKSITEILQQIQIGNRPGDVSIYVVVDDHRQREEPHVHEQHLTKTELAHNNDPSLVKMVLEQGLRSTISKWRDNR